MTTEFQLTVSGSIPLAETTTGPVTYFVVNKAAGTVVGSIVLPGASNIMHSFSMIVRVPNDDDEYDCGVFDDAGVFQSSGYALSAVVRIERPFPDPNATGAQGHRYDA